MQRQKLADYNGAYRVACRALDNALSRGEEESALNVLMDEIVRQRDIAEDRARFRIVEVSL